MKHPARLISIIAMAVAASAVGAPSASANYTTYWGSLHAGQCSSGTDIASVASNTTKRRGAFLNGLLSSEIGANGGTWLWGAFTSTSGTTTSTSYSQPGYWAGSWPLGGAANRDPFIKNLNGVTVGGMGCFQY